MGKLVVENTMFDLRKTVEEVASIMKMQAEYKGLRLTTQIDHTVPQAIYSEQKRLKQILFNLLGNAVKFTEDGGIRLYVSYNVGRLVATVSDTGPGISVADQERVFRAFERGAGSEGARTGAGLGLTITLQLAELMRGEISLDSLPGQGCTVSVHVPVGIAEETVAERALSPPAEATYATESRTVLLCDDDEDMLALLEHYLHRAGYSLITAVSATEAVDKTVSYRPDIVLMDVNLPGRLSGIEAADALRKKDYTGPIVALTASKLTDEETASFTRCFRKPAQMQQLLREIKNLTHGSAT